MFSFGRANKPSALKASGYISDKSVPFRIKRNEQCPSKPSNVKHNFIDSLRTSARRAPAFQLRAWRVGRQAVYHRTQDAVFAESRDR